MTTPRRLHDEPSAINHVIAQGVFGDKLAPDAAWATELYGALVREAHERGWDVWALCIMGTHYHLLVSTPDGSLAEGIQRAHSAHAIRRNRHHATRRGAVFGRRYDVFPIRDGEHLRNALRYIPRNPVKAGLCRDPADWPYGTYRAIAGIEPCAMWIPKARIFTALEGDFSDPYEPWFGEHHYRRLCSSLIETPTPPLRHDDWNRYDTECLRAAGKSTKQIAEALQLSKRYVRHLSEGRT